MHQGWSQTRCLSSGSAAEGSRILTPGTATGSGTISDRFLAFLLASSGAKPESGLGLGLLLGEPQSQSQSQIAAGPRGFRTLAQRCSPSAKWPSRSVERCPVLVGANGRKSHRGKMWLSALVATF